MISTQPPGSVTVNSGFGLVVTALDAYGNVATSYGGNVTLALANNPGLSNLSGKVTVTAVKGVASYSGLKLNRVANGYTIQARSGSLLAAVTNPFEVVSLEQKQQSPA
jgi:prophage DNA circulation protein